MRYKISELLYAIFAYRNAIKYYTQLLEDNKIEYIPYLASKWEYIDTTNKAIPDILYPKGSKRKYRMLGIPNL